MSLRQNTSNKVRDIYKLDRQLDRVWTQIKTELSTQNRTILDKYDTEMVNVSLGKATRIKHLKIILSITRKINKNWNDVNKDDISRIVREIMNEYGDVNGNETESSRDFKKILQSIIAQAQINGTGKAKIYTRIAQTNDFFWYDLGTPDFKAVVITAEKIRTVSLDENTPLFRRPQSMHEQVTPKLSHSAKSLDELCRLLHILSKDFVVFQSHLVCLLLEKYPVP
jgi:hypothetical protein